MPQARTSWFADQFGLVLRALVQLVASTCNHVIRCFLLFVAHVKLCRMFRWRVPKAKSHSALPIHRRCGRALRRRPLNQRLFFLYPSSKALFKAGPACCPGAKTSSVPPDHHICSHRVSAHGPVVFKKLYKICDPRITDIPKRNAAVGDPCHRLYPSGHPSERACC